METTPGNIFNYTVTAQSTDLDELAHVNNTVYLRWIQEAARAHWTTLTNAVFEQTYVWVILRHEIDYLRPALLNDQLLLHTWVAKNEALRSYRQTRIYNAASKQLLAEALTTWCLLDKKQLRPRRIGPDVLALLSQ